MWSIRLLFICMCLLSAGCGNPENSPDFSATASPTPRGPAVMNDNPDVILQSWEYIHPHSDKALVSFPSDDPEAIEFGPEHYEAYMVWRESGFDLIWGNVFCSTEPILVIKEEKISLWLNDSIWNYCESSQEMHTFKVNLETNIPPEEWTYILHKDAPP